MTREEELQILQEYIEKNGVKQLPPDERGPEILISAWTRRGRKKGAKKTKKTKKETATQNDEGQRTKSTE
jgi:hypothetical protein